MKFLKLPHMMVIGGLILAPVSLAHADDHAMLGSGFFVDGSLGASLGTVSDYTFDNPAGSATTQSATSGSEIILDNTDEMDFSLGGKAAIGYRYDSNIFAHASYSYIDDLEFEGFATFNNNPFQQLMTVNAHAFMLEVGYDHPINDKFFVEGSVGAGVALVNADAIQGFNQPGTRNLFPEQTRTNPAASLGLGVGYSLSGNWGLMVSGEYLYLGRASTGRTGAADVAASTGINLGEELSGEISVWRLSAGLRYAF